MNIVWCISQQWQFLQIVWNVFTRIIKNKFFNKLQKICCSIFFLQKFKNYFNFFEKMQKNFSLFSTKCEKCFTYDNCEKCSSFFDKMRKDNQVLNICVENFFCFFPVVCKNWSSLLTSLPCSDVTSWFAVMGTCIIWCRWTPFTSLRPCARLGLGRPLVPEKLQRLFAAST